VPVKDVHEATLVPVAPDVTAEFEVPTEALVVEVVLKRLRQFPE
jgi:hypothetical protein